ncbi:MAG: 7-carboxy-7-deazaguanine synthase QueE [Leptolyngbya sp. SIO4C5]|nr:7-carboxy-7-deazaguanine synthase QueE [Leptolyngbya sp. SIO4C5]
MKTIEAAQLTYPIVETFHSVQGEGTWSGTSAWFIRLGGCDVGCWFCDTKESWNLQRHPQQTVPQIVAAAAAAQPRIVVITGGEPLMHDLGRLTAALQAQNLKVHLETSGSHPFSGTFDWVTCSPKRFKPPHASVYPHVDELKVVIAQPEDFIWAEQQAALVPATAVKLLQPEWNTPESTQRVFDYVRQRPNWRLSLQTHKFLGLR